DGIFYLRVRRLDGREGVEGERRPARGQVIQGDPFRKHGERSAAHMPDEVVQNLCAVGIGIVEPAAPRFDRKLFERVPLALLSEIASAQKRDERNPPDRASAKLQ